MCDDTVPIKVIDVFAGPGGLNEGFASFNVGDEHKYEIAASIEKESVACETLRLRHAFRTVRSDSGLVPRAYIEAAASGRPLIGLENEPGFSAALSDAYRYVFEFTLDRETRAESDELIRGAVGTDDNWVLVGGPPCQLYSLAGRARASKLPGFSDDVRHVLYKEYLHIIDEHRPAVFVMENVKGMLSAVHHSGRIFDLIRDDIANLGYELRSLVQPGLDLNPSDYIIQSEDFGVPQQRHRVILLGIRKDIADRPSKVLRGVARAATVHDAIGDIPAIRSRLSGTRWDHFGDWLEARDYGLAAADLADGFSRPPNRHGGLFVPRDSTAPEVVTAYDRFVQRPEIPGFFQHESRRHMASDISRYAFSAQRVAMTDRRLKVSDFPKELLPNHKNVGRHDTPFTDRFRVQKYKSPSSTVVSHISKDGHYFIHPDPFQARSLTVREAARLQSFPDDYVFSGNRTQQFHQVGNAVPPFLARQIAEIVHGLVA